MISYNSEEVMNCETNSGNDIYTFESGVVQPAFPMIRQRRIEAPSILLDTIYSRQWRI